MHRPIGEAFDPGFRCFILGEVGEHRVHLFGAGLRNVKLTDTKVYPCLLALLAKKASKLATGNHTRDVEKQPMRVTDVRLASMAFAREFHESREAGQNESSA